MSKTRCDLPKFRRLQIISNILTNPTMSNGISTSQIVDLAKNQGVAVSKRTILRDLNELSNYMPIFDEVRDQVTFWFFSSIKKSI